MSFLLFLYYRARIIFNLKHFLQFLQNLVSNREISIIIFKFPHNFYISAYCQMKTFSFSAPLIYFQIVFMAYEISASPLFVYPSGFIWVTLFRWFQKARLPLAFHLQIYLGSIESYVNKIVMSHSYLGKQHQFQLYSIGSNFQFQEILSRQV